MNKAERDEVIKVATEICMEATETLRTGYAAALEDNATWAREFEVLQAGHHKLLKAVQEWRDDDTAGDELGMCCCGKCPPCVLRALAENTATPPPPAVEEASPEQDPYRTILEVGREWLRGDVGVCSGNDTCAHPVCVLAALIRNAEPDEERERLEKDAAAYRKQIGRAHV